MNKTILLGHLTAKPELRTTSNGKSVCSFSVATNSNYTGEDGEKKQVTDFHNVIAWGKAGEVIEQYLDKGSQIFLEGRGTTRSWEKNDGSKAYRHEVILEKFEFIGGNKGRSEESQLRSKPATEENYDDIKIEDIPF